MLMNLKLRPTLTAKKFKPVCVAKAFAIIVFEHPGGPYFIKLTLFLRKTTIKKNYIYTISRPRGALMPSFL